MKFDATFLKMKIDAMANFISFALLVYLAKACPSSKEKDEIPISDRKSKNDN